MSKSLGFVAALAASALSAISLSAAPAQKAVAARAPGAEVTISRCTPQRITTARSSKCQRASYSSLSVRQREVLDETLRLVRGEDQNAETRCVLLAHKWLCVGDTWICGCYHEPTGPVCSCIDR